MACSAIDCTPEDVLEEMGLLRKGDIYALKALCSKKKDRAQVQVQVQVHLKRQVQQQKLPKPDELHWD